jgi:hypothetical protein
VDVDGVLVIVLVAKHPLLNRIEPGLEDRDVREGAAVKGVHEGLRIRRAGEVVEEAAIDEDVAREFSALRDSRQVFGEMTDTF